MERQKPGGNLELIFRGALYNFHTAGLLWPQLHLICKCGFNYRRWTGKLAVYQLRQSPPMESKNCHCFLGIVIPWFSAFHAGDSQGTAYIDPFENKIVSPGAERLTIEATRYLEASNAKKYKNVMWFNEMAGPTFVNRRLCNGKYTGNPATMLSRPSPLIGARFSNHCLWLSLLTWQ